jgi:biotin carboxyl carrier protein
VGNVNIINEQTYIYVYLYIYIYVYICIYIGVSEGQFVEAGQQLAVVEAMKMQNVLRAAKAGTIKKVCVCMYRASHD